jgi:DNA-binding GntR family transcriptional regulator
MSNKTQRKVRGPSPPKSRARASIGPASDDPLYLQVVRALKDEIVSGVYPVGSHLPTEEELRRRFSVSRYTVREALRRLREDKLVSSRQGAGTTVVSPQPSDSHVHEVMSINDLVAFATGVRFAIETIEMIEVSGELAERIGVENGEPWLAVRGYRDVEGHGLPVCRTEIYVAGEFAAIGGLVQRHAGPIFHLIENMFGQDIVEVQQEIAAAIIPDTLAVGLKVEPGSVGLEVRRTYKLGSGKVAQIAINTHPASRFRHAMTMRRVKG